MPKTLKMVKAEANGRAQWIGPETIPDDDYTTIVFAVETLGFLLNTPERRGRWHSFVEFADIIETNTGATPKRDEVLRVLRKD